MPLITRLVAVLKEPTKPVGMNVYQSRCFQVRFVHCCLEFPGGIEARVYARDELLLVSSVLASQTPLHDGSTDEERKACVPCCRLLARQAERP